MLVVTELSEACEADREGNYCRVVDITELPKEGFKSLVKDTFEDELADVVIRVADLAGSLNIDLESHVKAKLKYNETRKMKHGKKY